jgi:hypothetical protein
LAAELAASTNGRTAMNLIAQLDDHCLQHDVDKQLPGEYRTGPFGVFEVKSTKSSPSEQVTTEIRAGATTSLMPTMNESRDTSCHHAQNEDGGPESTSPEDIPSNESSAEEIEILPQDDIFSVLDNFDTSLMRLSPQRDFWQFEDQFMQDLSMPMDLFGGDFTGLDFFDSLPNESTTEGAAGAFGQASALHTVDADTPKSRSHTDWAHLLIEAPSLLRCYESADTTSELAKQSFWRTFVLPSAVRTFGELSVFGKASDVASSTFYSTLANSAFAMEGSGAPIINNSHWRETSKSAEDAAHYYLQRALSSADPQPDDQELLSATLSLCLVSVSLLSEQLWTFNTDQVPALP